MTSRDLFLGLTPRQNESHRNVHSAFKTFYEGITLTGDQRTNCAVRRDDILRKLEKDFDILDSFATGSIPRYTALRKPDADMDIMIVLNYSKHINGRTPTQVLQAVRDSLGKWKTNVRKNGQAVTLHYSSWPSVDIVPVAVANHADGSTNYFNVPNARTGGWIKSNPRTHSAAVAARVQEYGPEFRRVIKLVKYWNLQHGEFLSSYHIEQLALNLLRGSFQNYPWELSQFFKGAKQLVSTGYLWDGFGYADSYLDYSNRQESVKRLNTAASKALDAWYETYTNNSVDAHKNAIEIWRQIFGDRFSQ